MRQAHNSLQARLSAGETVLAAFLFLPSPDVAEIMALSGFDALVVDREHIAADMESALHQLRAIRSVSDIPVLVRVRDHGEASIKPLLDAGYDGIVAANVESAAAARHIVAACHYPPRGRRGAHFTVSRGARYGLDASTYAQKAADETLVIAMIESADGVAAIEAIAAVDGIDMLFLGPLDLSGYFGVFGDLAHSGLLDVLASAAARIRATGKYLGGALVPSMSPSDAQAAGYCFITGQSDIGLLRSGTASFLKGYALDIATARTSSKT